MSATSDSKKRKGVSTSGGSQKKQKTERNLYFCVVHMSEDWGTLPVLHVVRIDPDKKGLVNKLTDTISRWDGYEFYIKYYTQDELNAALKFNNMFDLVVDEPLTSLDYDKIQQILDSDDKCPTINYMLNIGTKMGSTRFDVEE